MPTHLSCCLGHMQLGPWLLERGKVVVMHGTSFFYPTPYYVSTYVLCVIIAGGKDEVLGQSAGIGTEHPRCSESLLRFFLLTTPALV